MKYLDLEQYRNLTRKFGKYPDVGKGNNEELMYLALGLCDEAGEVAGKIKKVYRDRTRVPYEELVKELGDVLWYWSRLCEVMQHQCGEVAAINYEKLASRAERGVLGGSGDNR